MKTTANFAPCAMRYAWLAALLLPCFQLAGQEGGGKQPAPRAVPVEDLSPKFDSDMLVISSSEQFRISGSDAATRGSAANLAEATKADFLKLTEEQDEWKVPIRITLMGEAGDDVPLRETVLRLNLIASGYELGIFVNLSRGLRPEPLRRAVTEALVYARGVKDLPATEADVPLSVPPWFVEGMLEATDWRMKRSDRKLYHALSRHGGLFKLEDVFSLSEAGYASIDAVSRAAFRVSSGALVMALLEQPGGKEGMRGFLAELAPYQGEMPTLLRRHFPDLNLSANSLDKWWKLQLANNAEAPLSESLGVVQTERALEEALRLRHRNAEGTLVEIPVSEWETIAALPDAERGEAVRLAEDSLLRLSYRSFPSYRPLLSDYQTLLLDIVKGQTKGVAKTLASLAEARETMLSKAQLSRDFMDWFEITRARETSGAFDDYLNLKARLKDKPSTRKDGMSRYLDRLDPLFTLPQESRPEMPGGGLPQF